MLQVKKLFSEINELHLKHGDSDFTAIYGAGEINQPKMCFIFMNPTGRNVSSVKDWTGLRAPWLGTKNVWRMFYKLGILEENYWEKINKLKPNEWDVEFSEDLYSYLGRKSIYITNIAKCTKVNAKHLPDSVYKDFLPSLLKELKIIRPQITFAFGNQVSSILLGKNISVSNYQNDEFEILNLGDGIKLKIFPTYYPVGQGTPNMPKAMKRIQAVLKS